MCHSVSSAYWTQTAAPDLPILSVCPNESGIGL